MFPNELGLPDYFHDRYDPLWSLISDTGLPMCCHIGLNTNLDDLVARDPTPMMGVMVPMAALSAGEALGMWLLTGVLERFRDLKVVFVEPGLGWVAWYLYIVDDMDTRQQYDFPEIKELPSAYFHRNMFLTYIEEPDAIQFLRHRIGVENILWSTDYPHPVSSWPNSRALVEAQFRRRTRRRARADRGGQRGACLEPLTRPSPRSSSGDDRYFWDGVAEHRLLIQRCAQCGTLRHPPSPMCGSCGSLEWDTQEAKRTRPGAHVDPVAPSERARRERARRRARRARRGRARGVEPRRRAERRSVRRRTTT